MIALFFYVENQAYMMQPSEGWSIPVEVLEDLHKDYRLVDIMRRPDDEGILITSISTKGIEFYELNWLGGIERQLTIEEDLSDARVLDVGFDQSSYQVYVSDRVILERYIIDMDSLSVSEKTLVSETSEQFSVSGNAVIVGDDDITEIIVEDEVVADFYGYDDLKRANIFSFENKIIATMDTVMGSSVITIDDSGIRQKELISPAQENNLGYLQDVYYDQGVITILSSKHHRENFPSSFGMWQLDEDLEIINDSLWYHNRTSLRPIITNVDGDNIEYVLGVLTRQDENRDAVMEQPHLQDGTFVNILKFTRENQSLIDYNRLTTTRAYPTGYEFFQLDDGELIVWVDRTGESSTVKLAGFGEPYISYAKDQYTIEYVNIFSEIMMTFISSIIWGLIFAAMDLLDYIFPIIGFFLLVFIFNKVTNFEEEKKETILFVVFAVVVSSFKFYMAAIGNDSLQAYGHIYPQILGSDLVLGTISIITSICSIFLVNLWYDSNKDLSGQIHIAMYIGFEVYFYIFSIMVYVVSAMSKLSLMV